MKSVLAVCMSQHHHREGILNENHEYGILTIRLNIHTFLAKTCVKDRASAVFTAYQLAQRRTALRLQRACDSPSTVAKLEK